VSQRFRLGQVLWRERGGTTVVTNTERYGWLIVTSHGWVVAVTGRSGPLSVSAS